MVRREIVRLITALLSLSTLLLLSYHLAFADRVPPGYFLGTTHLAGKTKVELHATLEHAFNTIHPLTISTGVSTKEITPAALGITYDIAGMEQEILAPTNPLRRAVVDVQRLDQPVILTGALSIDEPVLTTAVDQLAKQLSVPPVDAAAGFDDSRQHFTIVPAKSGVAVTAAAIEVRVKEALVMGDSTILVPANGEKPTVTNEVVQPAVEQANAWLDHALTTTLSGSEVQIPLSVIRASISFAVTMDGDSPKVVAVVDPSNMQSPVRDFLAEHAAITVDQGAFATQIADAVVQGKSSVAAPIRAIRTSEVTSAIPAVIRAETPPSSGSGNFETIDSDHDAGGPGRTVNYTVLVENSLDIDHQAFADAVATTLDDARSWLASGKLHFARVASGGFPLYLASPPTVNRLCAPLKTNSFTSCMANGRVVINADRWRDGSPNFPGSLAEYRDYVINHEVGHRIGMHHHPCSGSGVAPVMHQQTLGMNGCEPGPWPAAFELDMVK